MKVKCILRFIPVLFLSACVSFQQSLSEEDAARIKATKVINIVAQDELRPAIVNPDQQLGFVIGPLAGALVGRAIADSRMEAALVSLRPIMEGTRDINFRQLQRQYLSKALQAADWLNVQAIADRTGDISHAELRAAATGKDDAVMTLYTRYAISPNFSTVVVHSLVKIWGKGKKEPLYTGNFEYQSSPVTAEDEPEVALSKWGAKKQMAYRSALNEGLEEIFGMIAYEVGERRASADMGMDAVKLSYTTWEDARGRIELEGKAVRQMDDRTWMRVANGVLVSLPRTSPM